MKKMAMLAVLLGAGACAEIDENLLFTTDATWVNDVQTTYLGRSWLISRNAENATKFRAIQDNNNLNPFGRPAMRKSIQATRAIEQSTGCKVVQNSLYKNVSDVFYAAVVCPDTSAN